MKALIAYTAGVVTLPAIAGVVVLADKLFANKTEYDCGWCSFTTREDADDSLVETPFIVAEVKIRTHETLKHPRVTREFRKLVKKDVGFFEAKRQATSKFPSEVAGN